ncbi:MAG: ATP phosphoribosyltransferase [Opitutaceae bacterium]|nr:ATP phosphoribosyltransferase [Cytophagales bacterium]
MSNVLRLAIQKSGRLSEDSLTLIKECGIDFNKSDNKLTSKAFNFPIEFLFLRDDDIPGYVEDAVADLGIVGQNVLEEKGKQANIVEKLGFSKCRLSIAVPKDYNYESIKSLEGKNIATSYPKILGDFLKKNNVSAHIHEISGSVEIAPNIGLAEGICDLVSSGSTLISNGLKEAETILHSQALLIANKNLSAEKTDLVNQLLFRIKSVQRAKNTKYILLNAPTSSVDTIISLLPGVKSPSVMPLAEEGWVSLHSVVKENEFWDIVEKLKAAGAEGILVMPIEKIVI